MPPCNAVPQRIAQSPISRDTPSTSIPPNNPPESHLKTSQPSSTSRLCYRNESGREWQREGREADKLNLHPNPQNRYLSSPSTHRLEIQPLRCWLDEARWRICRMSGSRRWFEERMSAMVGGGGEVVEREANYLDSWIFYNVACDNKITKPLYEQ